MNKQQQAHVAMYESEWSEVWRHARTGKYYIVTQDSPVNREAGMVLVRALLGGEDGAPYGPAQPRRRDQLNRLYTQIR